MLKRILSWLFFSRGTRQVLTDRQVVEGVGKVQNKQVRRQRVRANQFRSQRSNQDSYSQSQQHTPYYEENSSRSYSSSRDSFSCDSDCSNSGDSCD